MQSLIVLGAAAVGMANAINIPRNYYGDNSTTTEEMTTSTVYATNVHTVTQCPPEVPDCPVGHVTTETIAVYTTYCPVTAVITVPSGHTKPVVETTKPVETKPVYTKPAEPTTEEMTTSTIYTTNVHTVTKCPPEVPDCPVGHVTTETVAISTTVCPVTEVHTKPTQEHPTEPKPTKPVETHTVPAHPPHYGNQTTTGWTTSTIYTTHVNTVTKCPPEVPNCPVGHTTTKTYAVSTTVCPVTETHPVETHPVVPVPEPSKPVETHPVVVPSKPVETKPVEPTKPAETHPVVPVPEPSKPVETHPVVVPSKPVETKPVEPTKPAETHPVVPVPEPSKPVETHPVVPVPEPSKPVETHPVVPEPSKPVEPTKPVEPVPTTPVPDTPVVTGAAGRMGLDVAAIVAGAAVFLL